MSELEYRRALRAMPREIEPARDLWPAIEARLRAQSVPPRRRPAWLLPALAAGVAAATLAITLQLLPAARSPRDVAAAPAWSVREADLIKADLDAALVSAGAPGIAEYTRAPGLALSASLRELDSAQAELDQALRLNPDSTFLLDRMRRVQQQKARLTLRALAA
jgi:hypothetical protein